MKKTLILMILCIMASISTSFAVDTNHVIGTNVVTIHNEADAPVACNHDPHLIFPLSYY